ncbi:hypothetical protein M9H77_26093 [Catharanthus roseus]|uniref:Uncharacterized protein n=1 Tax=Catharanthus roseus TaxID=4058 RepID=A0ACC0AA97_CATRO|nr:hypothetical protein M9H77_26093 [Catharanthus roseus]
MAGGVNGDGNLATVELRIASCSSAGAPAIRQTEDSGGPTASFPVLQTLKKKKISHKLYGHKVVEKIWESFGTYGRLSQLVDDCLSHDFGYFASFHWGHNGIFFFILISLGFGPSGMHRCLKKRLWIVNMRGGGLRLKQGSGVRCHLLELLHWRISFVLEVVFFFLWVVAIAATVPLFLSLFVPDTL